MTLHRFRVRLSTGTWRSTWLDDLPMSCGCDGSLKEWLEDKIGEPIEEYRYQPTQSHVQTVTLTLGEKTNFYPVRTFIVSKSYEQRARYWLAKLGDYEVRKTLRFPPFPTSTHYC